jgi:hypothetical protein
LLIEPDKTLSYCYNLLEGWEGDQKSAAAIAGAADVGPHRGEDIERCMVGPRDAQARASLGRRREMARPSLDTAARRLARAWTPPQDGSPEPGRRRETARPSLDVAARRLA